MFHFEELFGIPRSFVRTLTCFPVIMLPGNERDSIENGGKIILPPSALNHLSMLNIDYPMLFRLNNVKFNRITHSGVLEFTAAEGTVFLPQWMMQNLLLAEGDPLTVESVSLPKATFSRFQPHTSDFMNISNPKAVLENCLRNFPCLTTGDVITILYNAKAFELSVLETKPGVAVCIIECDMSVDFAEAADNGRRKEDVRQADEEMEVGPDESATEKNGFVAFRGEGMRLDGKLKKSVDTDDVSVKEPLRYGIPDHNYTIGSLVFIRKRSQTSINEVIGDVFQPFTGKGHSFRKKHESKME